MNFLLLEIQWKLINQDKWLFCKGNKMLWDVISFDSNFISVFHVDRGNNIVFIYNKRCLFKWKDMYKIFEVKIK